MKLKSNTGVPKITPFLWFDGQAGAAAKFYTSVFKHAEILCETPMVCGFQLEGQRFMALNGGPHFKFNEAVSFLIDCRDQREVDYFWKKLTSGGGQEGQCGWLKDKFGVSWQVVPSIFGDLVNDPDQVKAGRVMQAMMGMKKLVIADLKKAHAGR